MKHVRLEFCNQLRPFFPRRRRGSRCPPRFLVATAAALLPQPPLSYYGAYTRVLPG